MRCASLLADLKIYLHREHHKASLQLLLHTHIYFPNAVRAQQLLFTVRDSARDECHIQLEQFCCSPNNSFWIIVKINIFHILSKK